MDLPAVNAVLNTTSACFIVAGIRFIRAGNRKAHQACMLAALGASSLFLVSYLVYHATHGATRFAGGGWSRPFYFALLISHTVLATAVVPLVWITFWQALKHRFERHKRWARWTFPIWLYVSVTGVVVYGLLYHVYPAG